MIIAVIILAMLSIMLLIKIKILKKELEKIKKLRIQEAHNNTILLNKNSELTRTLAEVAKIAYTNPVDSEKITLGKIKELVRDYQI